ncbi:hypothetical protein SAMN02745248_00616 [Hathewaya proteolytica DSM 3090]|uniref:CNNM transmembrane domain-containing protein n=1 Tax=Hathewaya proteolytica DSM 3090 TaxID=1121331 RepID=A0A1M6L4A4_9CLOT|nr:CNNM domain-containing protein [Hathewaya proteolytica]SHJ66051.1 hypothetical protein SAMN02745248_00616 [Hathewaya proteolytica DSM 3090]
MGNGRKKRNPISQKKWIAIIFIWTIILGGCISLLSDSLLSNATLLVAFIIVILIILVGILFDAIGTSITAVNEMPFHAMASKKVKGAATAVRLIRNADKVSNFCNDVIGDICGIVSGSAGAIITEKFIQFNNVGSNSLIITLLPAMVGAIIAAMTIGGKAIGKSYAINNSKDIIFRVAKIIQIFVKEN